MLGAQCRTAHASRVLWSFNQSSALRSFLLYPHLLIPHLFDYSITYLYEYGLMDIYFFFGLKWDFNLHALHGAPIWVHGRCTERQIWVLSVTLGLWLMVTTLTSICLHGRLWIPHHFLTEPCCSRSSLTPVLHAPSATQFDAYGDRDCWLSRRFHYPVPEPGIITKGALTGEGLSFLASLVSKLDYILVFTIWIW